MIVRRGGEFDLAAFGQLAVQGDDLSPSRAALLVQEPVFFDFGIIPPLRLELGQLRVFLEKQGVEPGQIRPDLKVAEVALSEPGEGLFAGRNPQSAHLEELPVAGMRADHGVGERHEEVVEQVKGVVLRKAIGRHSRDVRWRSEAVPSTYPSSCKSRLGTRLMVQRNSGTSSR